ncbi:MAG: sugar ABC transporter substrate-binding protein [Anaerolineales bacterium]
MCERRTFIAILCTPIVLWLSACSLLNPPPTATPSIPTIAASTPTAPAPTPTQAPLSGTVSIWHAWSEVKLPALLKAIDAFQELYPDVVFDVQYVPLIDLKSAYEVASSEGRAPLVMNGPTAWGPELYNNQWIADVSASVPDELVANLNPAAVEASRYKDALIGLPITIEGVVLYRNASLIPERAATYDDLLDMARRAVATDVVGAYLERSFYYSGGHLSGVGGSLMDAEGYPAFNDEFGLRWVDLLRQFELAGPTEFFGDNDLQYFTENRSGYLIESTRQRNALEEALGASQLSIDPWPITEQGSLSGFVEAESVYLSPLALDPANQATLEFINMLLSVESQIDLAEEGAIPAIRASVALAPGSQVSVQDKLTQQAMVVLEQGVTYPVVPEMAFYGAPLDIALQSIFVDGVQPQAALQTAEETIRAAVDSYKSSEAQNP